MNRNLMILPALVLSLAAAAQDDDLPQLPEGRLEEIKAQKVAYLTQKMSLTTEEAQKFWPIYNEYDKGLEAIRKERREAHKAMKDKTDLTEAEASAAIDKEM